MGSKEKTTCRSSIAVARILPHLTLSLRQTNTKKDNMTEVAVRSGERSDMAAVVGLIKELAIYENAEEEAVLTPEQLEADGFEKNLFETFVAEVEGTVVGFALFYKRYSTWKGMTIYLEDLYISEKHRRAGIGYKLFDAVAKRAQALQATRLEWQVFDWNQSAIDFYVKKLDSEMDRTWINCRLDQKRIQEWN